MGPGHIARAAGQIRSGDVYKFRGSYAWRITSEWIRRQGHNECVDCKARGWYSPAEEVHHVIPVRAAPELALVASNLLPLCGECHGERHREKSEEPLTEERW